VRIDRNTISAVLASVALMISGVALYFTKQMQNDLDKPEEALPLLCAWKDSMVSQINADWQFLEQHPEGTEGISKESVERDIENTRTTLDIISPYLENCAELEGRG
jgi:hypothetical protein